MAYLLPDLTLVMIETREWELASLALYDCLDQCRFDDVLLFTNGPAATRPGDQEIRVVQVPDWGSKLEWSQFSWFGVPRHIRTKHVLFIQWDSWVVNPSAWRDEFTQYDYIGPPWWHTDGRNVGNGGFSIRSLALIRYIARHQADFPCTTSLDDDLLCRKYRHKLECAGFSWAPEGVAADFAFECVDPAPGVKPFGFHGMFNWGKVLPHDRLVERARVARNSPSVYGSYMWQAFCQANPTAVAELELTQDGKRSCIFREGGT